MATLRSGINTRTWHVILLAALASTASCRAGTSERDLTTKSLADIVERAQVQAGIPGVSVAVITSDGALTEESAGFADRDTRRRVRPDTAFALASVSKLYVAVLSMKAVEAGQLRLTDPLAHWMPDYPRAAAITVRDLLAHTSGVGQYADEFNRYRGPSFDAAVTHVEPPKCDPGTCWYYSDTNYLLLGSVLEAATGSPLSLTLRRDILEPLHLAQTFAQPGERARESAHVYGPNDVDTSDGTDLAPNTGFVEQVGAAGSIAASAADVARFGAALFGGRVVSASSLQAMTDPQGSARLRCIANCPANYGLGVMARSLFGQRFLGHDGSQGAILAHFPDRGITIAVLTNVNGASGRSPLPVLRAVMDAVGLNPDFDP